MALQTSGAISIANLNNYFPGSGTSMSNFYRGGGRVPATRTVTTTVTVREPTSGELYSFAGTFGNGEPYGGSYFSRRGVYWNNAQIGNPGSATSLTSGGFTYFQGNFRETVSWDEGGEGSIIVSEDYYGVFRTSLSSSTSTININTGIPTSGQISLSQFYGAVNS